MQGNEKDLIVFVEFFLCAIPVMNVPVENANSFSLFSRHFCSDSHVIEDTKSSRLPTLRMMTWWSRYAIPSLQTRILKNMLHAPSCR